MRINWHRGDHDHAAERPEPAWQAGRPVETAGSLRIAAPRAAELAHHEEPHVAA
jgi:hypothetical protein